MRVGTAGQALSHLTVLESLVGGSFDHALVLEDDAAVAPALLTTIDAAIGSLPAGWHVLSLDCAPSCLPAPGQPDTAPAFVAEGPCAVSTHAYVASRLGYDAMLDAAVPLHTALAEQLRAVPSLVVACARPALAAENDLRSDRAARDAPHDEL